MKTKKKITIDEFLSNDDCLTIQINDISGYYEDLIKKAINKISINRQENPNFDIYDLGKSNNVSEILDSFNTFPFLNKFRYVIVKGISNEKKEEIQSISNYLKSPCATTKHFFLLEDSKVNLSCDYHIEDNNTQESVESFITEELKKRKIKIDTRIIKRLTEKNLTNRLLLIKVIDKIESLFISKKLNNSNLIELVEESRRESFDETYNLMKFINDKDLKSCILELEKTKFTEDIFLEINKIAWRFRTYLKIKTLKRQKINDSEIIKSINVSKYQYKYLNAESSSKTFDELLNSLRTIKETDRLLKSTNINHDIISFYLLKNLCK